MRTVVEFEVAADCVVEATGADREDACLALVRAILRDERLLRPVGSELVSVHEIKSAYNVLLERARRRKSGVMPTDPQDALLQDVAREVLSKRAVDESPELIETIHGLASRAISQSLSILAQMPLGERERIDSDLVDIIDDRERDVFGLLFRRGVRFVVRLRFREPDVLKAATERLVGALASRPGVELNDIVAGVPEVSRVEGKLKVHFDDIELKTPAGELAQTGEVHEVSSQVGLLAYLSVQAPQIYLVWVTLTFAALDFFLEVGIVPSLDVKDLSLTAWIAQFLARLSTGAFGAYLVALFLRFAELRKHLRAVGGRGRRRNTAFGAFIEWNIA